MAVVEQIIVLRHARAGSKLADPSKDLKRALDRKGLEVALRLPGTIEAHLRPAAIVSSPFQRCLQTVEPLAGDLDLPIVEDDRFTPGRSEQSVRQAVVELPTSSVVCTHGEIIGLLFDDRVKCAKGAFWVVERRAGELSPKLYVEAPTRGQRSKR